MPSFFVCLLGAAGVIIFTSAREEKGMKTYKDYKTFEQYLNEHFDYFAEVGVPVKVYWMASNGDITLFYSQNRFRDNFFEDADFLFDLLRQPLARDYVVRDEDCLKVVLASVGPKWYD